MEPAPGEDTASLPGPAGSLPDTGDPGVDSALTALLDLAALPVEEHPAVFEQVHRRLTEALGETDGPGVPARPPGRPAGPGHGTVP